MGSIVVLSHYQASQALSIHKTSTLLSVTNSLGLVQLSLRLSWSCQVPRKTLPRDGFGLVPSGPIARQGKSICLVNFNTKAIQSASHKTNNASRHLNTIQVLEMKLS